MEYWNYQISDLETELQKLQNSYQLKKIPVNLGDLDLELIKVANIDDLLDRANDPDEIPFWAEIWPASIGLASFMLRNKAEFEGKTLLELGAGVGLAGIAAKLAGAKVVQSDFTVEALRFTRINCLRNNIVPSELLLADWRNFPTNIKFDLIIGADILYEKTLHNQLAKIFENQLNSDGIIWLADPGRNYGKDFIKNSKEAGWIVNEDVEAVYYEERNYQIDIYGLKPKGTSGNMFR